MKRVKIYEYDEGKKARENFDAAMRGLFRAPKTVSMSQPKKKLKRKTSGRASSASPKGD